MQGKGYYLSTINTVEDCQKFLDSCFYPPKGIEVLVLQFLQLMIRFYNSKKETTPIIMLETRESVTNLSEILKLKLLEVIYVGPFDLSVSYGKSPDTIFCDNEMKKKYKDILRKVKKAKKIAAIHCVSADTAIFFLKMGYDFVTLSTDMGLLKKSLEVEQQKLVNHIKKF